MVINGWVHGLIKGGASIVLIREYLVLMCRRVWHCSDISKNLVQVAVQNMFLKPVALVLPVTTATVEETFSDMEMVKTRLRSRLGEDTPQSLDYAL